MTDKLQERADALYAQQSDLTHVCRSGIYQGDDPGLQTEETTGALFCPFCGYTLGWGVDGYGGTVNDREPVRKACDCGGVGYGQHITTCAVLARGALR